MENVIGHHLGIAPKTYFDPLVNPEDFDSSEEENNQHDKVLDNWEAPEQEIIIKMGGAAVTQL